MRVAVLSTFPPAKCGIAEYTYDLVTSVMKVNNKIDFVIFRLSVPEGSTSEQYPLPRPADIVDVGSTVNPNYKKVLETLSREGKVDVLHIQHEYSIHRDNEKFLEFIREAKKLCNTLIVTMHTVRHVLYYPGIDKVQKAICNVADIVVVHSVLQENELVLQGADSSKIVRIPHGTRLVEKRLSKLDAAHELGLDELVNRRVLLVQGFLRRDKGLHLLVQALKTLVGEFRRTDVTLIIAGQIQHACTNKAYVDSVMQELHTALAKYVIVMNKYLSREEIDILYSLADIVLFPYIDVSGDLGVSGAFHWALGSFKPLVCARVPRLVEFYELAPRLTFPPGNAESLAAKIDLVLGNYEDTLKYMKPVFDYAIETSWMNIAKIYVELYRGEKPYMVDLHMFKLRRREEFEERPAVTMLRMEKRD